MHFGYARVSTDDQHLHLQTDALTRAGCERIFQEKVSGATADRPELTKLLEQLRAGDTITVWKLDRLGRSTKHLIELINLFAEKGVGFRAIHSPIDTTTATGKFTFVLFAALAELERETIRERTHAGLAAARARGRTGGRKRGLTPDKLTKAPLAKTLYEANVHSVDNIARQLGVGKATLYKMLRHEHVPITPYQSRKPTPHDHHGPTPLPPVQQRQ